MANLDTSQLICLARDGGTQARATLLAYFREYVRLLARLHVKPVFNAKFDDSDIVQETLLQADRSFHQFRGTTERELAAWLRQILANKGAEMARGYLTEKRNVQIEVQLHNGMDASSMNIASIIPSEYQSPSSIISQRERAVQLATAISRVSGDKREVLILHGLQGMSIADVAKSMGSLGSKYVETLGSRASGTSTIIHGAIVGAWREFQFAG